MTVAVKFIKALCGDLGQITTPVHVISLWTYLHRVHVIVMTLFQCVFSKCDVTRALKMSIFDVHCDAWQRRASKSQM